MLIERPIGEFLWFANFRWQADLCKECRANAVIAVEGKHYCSKCAKKLANIILETIKTPYKQTRELYKEVQKNSQ